MGIIVFHLYCNYKTGHFTDSKEGSPVWADRILAEPQWLSFFGVMEDPCSAYLPVLPSLEFGQRLPSWLSSGCLSVKHHVLSGHLSWEGRERAAERDSTPCTSLCIGEGNLSEKVICKLLFMCHWPKMCHMSSPKPTVSIRSVVTVTGWEDLWFTYQGQIKEEGPWPSGRRGLPAFLISLSFSWLRNMSVFLHQSPAQCLP